MNSALAMRGQTSLSAKRSALQQAGKWCALRSASVRRVPHQLPLQHRPSLATSASVDSRGGDSSFLTGFVVGGVLFGALGFLFAPQISKSLLGDDQRLRLPRFMEEEQQNKDPEQTKQDLTEKIAKLNASIDEVSNKLKDSDKVEVQA